MRLALAIATLGTILGAGCSDLGPEPGLVVTAVERRFSPALTWTTLSPGVTQYDFETTVEVEVRNTSTRDLQIDRCTSTDEGPAFGLRQRDGAWSPLVPSRACTSTVGLAIAAGETVVLRLSASSSFRCDADECLPLDYALWQLQRLVLWADGKPIASDVFAVMPPYTWCAGVVAGLAGIVGVP